MKNGYYLAFTTPDEYTVYRKLAIPRHKLNLAGTLLIWRAEYVDYVAKAQGIHRVHT